MIAFNATVLIIQSARDVEKEPRMPGYFNHWEDYTLLVIFCIFTVEVVAKMIVSGLIINPPANLTITESKPPESSSPDSETTKPAYTEKGQAVRSAHSRKPSASNTLDSLAVFGDTIKRSAHKALKPDAYDVTSHPQKSPNRVAYAPGARPFDQEPSGTSTLEGEFGTLPSDNGTSHAKEATYSSSAMQSTLSQPFRRTTADDFMHRRKQVLPFAEAIVLQRAQAPYYAYLRHSWNRIDLVAVVSFWVCFWLAITHQELKPNYHIFIFRAISVLRCARLLTMTSGTATILASLKQAGPLLVNVSFFIVFALLLFSIIGVQVFRGSYRRSCVWIPGWANDTEPGISNQTLSQICGAYTDPSTGAVLGHILSDGSYVAPRGKGYQCPLGQACVEDSNPMNGAQSFDNIFASLLQIVILISSNNWSNAMYDMVDANYFAATIFFILGIIVTNFWMANLLVAVITNCFASITSQTNHSAFAAGEVGAHKVHLDEDTQVPRKRGAAVYYRKLVQWSKWVWIILILVDVGLQAASDWTVEQDRQVVDFNLWFAVVFDIEIILRIGADALDGDWKAFFTSGRNDFDLFLAIMASITQIPPVKLGDLFRWFTVWSLIRFYRVILAVPRMGSLLNAVIGSVAGLLNMILFLFLMVGLGTLIAIQLFRGDIPTESDGQWVEITFKQTWNGFLGMYQVSLLGRVSDSI